MRAHARVFTAGSMLAPFHAAAADAGPEPAAPPSTPEFVRSPTALNVRSAPNTDGAIVGLIAADAPFLVMLRVPGPACGSDAKPGEAKDTPASWGLLPGGYACLSATTADPGPPEALPHIVVFDPPTPEEYRSYVRSGTWPRDLATAEALTPFIYGKTWRHWQGTTYATEAAWERGDAPLAALEPERKYHFVGVVETPRGALLEMADGSVVPLDDVYVYPISRFHGEELAGARSLAQGEAQAWVFAYGGANLRAAPAPSGALVRVVPYQAALRVRATADPRWVEVPDGVGAGQPGYLSTSVLRVATPAAAPEGVGPGTTWVDVDTAQQVLMLMRGESIEFATLVSTGVSERDTPPGVYAMTDKTVFGDMASRPGAPEDEAYAVESVPWVMHFRPRYALHGAFWHWGFGHTASHGCVNLAPLDAQRIFDAMSPTLPAGWATAYASAGQPGTTVRIR